MAKRPGLWAIFRDNLVPCLNIGAVLSPFWALGALDALAMAAQKTWPDSFWTTLLFMAIGPHPILPQLFLAGAILFWIRKRNERNFLFRGDIYHDYCYAWYWFCSKILGFGKCDLVLVPIHMQFRLAIKGTFRKFPVETLGIAVDDTRLATSSWIVGSPKNEDINLLLEDTYQISDNQISRKGLDIGMVKVQWRAGPDKIRHHGQLYIQEVAKVVGSLRPEATVHIFATTNPLNTYRIATDVFRNRGGVRHLFVHQQEAGGAWPFDRDGRKIF